MELITPRLEILPAPQRALWKELATLPRPFVLYGGTGLALQLGHRDSVDFDFFSSQPLDKRGLLALPLFRGAAIKQDAENTLSVEVARTDEPVKFSFFGSLTMGRVENPAVCRDHGLKLASLLDIGGLKAAVVQKRAQAKDYGDVAALIQAGVSLERMAGAAAALYPGQFAAPNTLRALAYFEDGDLPTLSRAKREVLDAAVREFRGVVRIVRASISMTLTESEAVPALSDLRSRFTLAAADPVQRAELVKRAGWIGVELSGSQTRAEQKQWMALAQELLERRPGFDPEQFTTRAATQAKSQQHGRER